MTASTQGAVHEAVPGGRIRIAPRRLAILTLALCLLPLVRPGFTLAQLRSGNLYGEVTDNQGEPLPGVTVTLTGPGSPRIAVTNAEGQFRFLGLDPGNRSIKAELEGFSTVDYPEVTIREGRNTTLEVTLTPAVEEVITVTSESPLLDERKISTGTTVTQIELEKIPSARDPWAVLQTVPGVQTDRVNVGGNESGQQSNFVGSGSGRASAAWSVDGVVITDPAARGASPSYYDFDAFEEIDPSTGGSDASLATGGVTLNLVTKRGTNEWRFSGRYLTTDPGWGGSLSSGPDPGVAPDVAIDLRPAFDGSGYCADLDLAGRGAGAGYPPAGIVFDPAPIVPVELFDPPIVVDLDGDGLVDSGIRSVPGCGGAYGIDLYDVDPFPAGTGFSPGGLTFGHPDAVLPDLSDPTSSARDEIDASFVLSRPLSDRWLLRGHLSYLDWQWETQEPLVDLSLHDNPAGGDCYRVRIVLPEGRALPGFGPGDAVQFDTPLPYGFLDRDQAVVPPCDPGAPDLHFVPSLFVPSHLVGGQSLQGLDLRGILPGSDSFYVRGRGTDDGPVPNGGGPDGFFILGVDIPGESVNPQGTGAARFELDLDGDGVLDTPILQGSDFTSPAPGISYGAFTVEPAFGGGLLTPDPDAPDPDAIFLQDRVRLNDYFSLNLGVRADAFEPSGAAGTRAPDASELFADGTGIDARLGGVYRSGGFQTSGGPDLAYGADLTLRNPILKDRLWFWGIYGASGRATNEDRFSYFTPRFFDDGLSRGADASYWSGFTLPSIRSAPSGRGVQDVGLEIQVDGTGIQLPFDERYAPGGGAESPRALEPADEPLIYVVSKGGATGEVFEVVVVHPAAGRVAIDGVVVVEPVGATGADRERFERELARRPGPRESLTAAGYCLELDRSVPPPGTVYRVAPAAKQERYAPLRRAMEATREVRDEGALDPDSDPEDYYHSIRQWAVWTTEKGFDREAFLDAFVERTEKNFREAGQPWSPDVAGAVRTYGEGRWTDIRRVLDRAEAP